MTPYLNLVEEFHRAMKQHWPTPTTPSFDADTNALRPKLLVEELKELHVALVKNDRLEQLDALCDIQYVLSGAVLAWGLRASFEATQPVMRLIKVSMPEQYVADMMGMVGRMAVCAENGFATQVTTLLVSLQEKLTTLVYSLGFQPVFVEAFKEVHRSNLTKLWDTPDYRANEVYQMESTEGNKWIARRGDGKIVKSPTYSPADLSRFL